VLLVDEPLYEIDDLLDVLGRERVLRRRAYVKRRRGIEVRFHISFGDLTVTDAFRVRLVDDLVIDVGEVLDVRDLIALVLEVPSIMSPATKASMCPMWGLSWTVIPQK